MKKCRWNIQRPVWAFLVILCCHGNFADDPLPSFTQFPDDVTQRQTQKTIPIDGLIDATSKTNDFSSLASIELAEPGASFPVDGKSSVVTNFLDQPSPSIELGNEDNTSTPPNDGKIVDSDQQPSISKSMGSNLYKLAVPDRSNSLLMEGVVLETPLPAFPVKDASSMPGKEDTAKMAADLANQEEAPLPEQPSEDEPRELPKVTEEDHKIKKEAATTGKQSSDSEANSEPIKQPNVVEFKSEADHAAPVQLQQQAQPPLQYPMDGSGTPVTEDMPSFSEWSKKRLEEQVKQGSNPPAATSQQNKGPPKQVRHKNYASVDCGAKVINANPEAQSTGAVLSHFRDDYMLNPCTAKIWLVIELCESIQADRIDLANFELFSSSPREFSVYSSDRYPSRDWTFLGTFEATDERTVQNFSFGHTTFGKYIKVEMVSHYGSEHFCPLSLVRVFGTSEYEALETEESADSHGRSLADEDDEVASDGENLSSQESQNLFGSAKDVVMNIVKKVLRSDKSDSASSDNGIVIQSSASSEDNSSCASKKCVCLQRLPTRDCEEGEEKKETETTSKCPKEAAIAHLRCHYPELLSFLLHVWPGTFHGRLLEQCFSTCVPHIEECGGEPADFSALGCASPTTHPTCLFYSAIMGPVSFGALCQLDKLLLDEHSRQPLVVLQCQSANSTSNLTAASLDLVHVPNVTPTALFETASRLVGIAKSAAGVEDLYRCDSLDHIAVCSTKLDATAVVAPPSPGLKPRASDSQSVIQTGAIVLEEHLSEGSQAASSSSSFQSRILPTRTLTMDVKSPTESKAIPSAKVQSVLGSELRASVSKNEGTLGLSNEDRSMELPPIASLDPSAASSPADLKAAVPSSRETRSSSAASKSVDESTSGSDVKPDGAKVPKEQTAREPPVDLTAAVLPPPNANVVKEGSGSAPQQGADADSDSAILEQEQAAYDEGAAVVPPSPQSGFTTNGESVVMAGGGNGKLQNNGGANGAGMVPPSQKESVFVRLSNRIKALELNMSLSSQYLEELSQRYRKQMEEMQKAFNKTIGALNETARSAYERDIKQQEVILKLQSQLDNMYKMVLNLQEEQDGIHATVVTRHILLMAVEACVMGALVMACARSSQKLRGHSGRAVSVVHPNTSTASKRSPNDEGRKNNCDSVETANRRRRRNSDSSAVGRHCPGASNGLDRRRQSTEVLNVSGSYSDLMIVEPTIPVWTAEQPLKEQEHSRKKKKHKNKHQGKQELYRSMSNNVLLYSSNSQKPPPAPPKNPFSRKNSVTGMSSAGLLFAAAGKSAVTCRVQDLNRNEKKQGEGMHPDYGGRALATSSTPPLVNGSGTQYSFTNLFSGYYGICPPPQFPPKLAPVKLPLHPHQQQNGGLKKSAVEKVCG